MMNLFIGGVVGDESKAAGQSIEALVRSKMPWVNVKQWPATPNVDAPADVPHGAATMFSSSENSMLKKDWSLAGVGYRTSIDRAVRSLGENDGTLYARINKLLKAGKITPQIADWAHHVRLGGNDGTHDPEELTEQQAKELQDFTKLFLEMTFTIPKRIGDAQAKRAAKKAS